MDAHRIIRILVLLTTALATPLLIATTITSGRPLLWALNFIPLWLTIWASATALWYHRRNGRMPDFRYSLIDLVAVLVYLGLLIPIWAIEIGRLWAPGIALLAGYTTAPMIVNMFTHIYFFVRNGRLLWTWIFTKAVQECPNCHSKFTSGVPRMQETAQRSEGYSLLRGEDYLDADAIAYTEGRASEDQIGVKGAADEETKGKGAITI